jgi:hypothetical protein
MGPTFTGLREFDALENARRRRLQQNDEAPLGGIISPYDLF